MAYRGPLLWISDQTTCDKVFQLYGIILPRAFLKIKVDLVRIIIELELSTCNQEVKDYTKAPAIDLFCDFGICRRYKFWCNEDLINA